MKYVQLLSIGLVALLVMSAASGLLIKQIGGSSKYEPEEMDDRLSLSARALLNEALEGVDPGTLVDHHAHVVGVGVGGTGAWVNEKLLTWRHPVHRLKTSAYLSGAKIKDMDDADHQYVQRLVRLARHFPRGIKVQLLAFDHHYRRDGSINYEKSEFYVPNEYVFQLAETYPDIFVPAISVHPYRADALAELDKWAAQGMRFVKWVPNAQGINASDPELQHYYERMIEHDMILLTHVGEEQAVEAEEDQALGNPLLFRKPLDMGLKVVMAHCASLGMDEDLDNPGQFLSSFELFIRLMDNPAYEDNLFGELSAMTQFNRLPEPIIELMKRTDLHHRLINGSDYPLPAINVVIRTSDLQKYGMLTAAERQFLNEIYDYNPLLFDFVLKRTIRVPGTDIGFPSSVFGSHPALMSH